MSFHESGDEDSWFEIAEVIILLLPARRNVRTLNFITYEVITMHLKRTHNLHLQPELIQVQMFWLNLYLLFIYVKFRQWQHLER